MIERCAAWALADGAGNMVDRQRRDRGQGLPSAANSPPEGGQPGRTLPVARNSLAKFGDLREARCRQTTEFSGFRPDMHRPPLSAGFCYFRILASRSSANCRAGLRGLGERGASRRASQPGRQNRKKSHSECRPGANSARRYGVGATIRASEMQALLIAINTTAAT